jgi:hypothetical protein
LVTVKGWAVHGYFMGKEIDYDWFETRDKAEKERGVTGSPLVSISKLIDSLTPPRGCSVGAVFCFLS